MHFYQLVYSICAGILAEVSSLSTVLTLPDRFLSCWCLAKSTFLHSQSSHCSLLYAWGEDLEHASHNTRHNYLKHFTKSPEFSAQKSKARVRHHLSPQCTPLSPMLGCIIVVLDSSILKINIERERREERGERSNKCDRYCRSVRAIII